MVVTMHEDSNDVDHYLSDQDIDHDENDEGKPKCIELYQVFKGFF
jgi:hypothetical protein